MPLQAGCVGGRAPACPQKGVPAGGETGHKRDASSMQRTLPLPPADRERLATPRFTSLHIGVRPVPPFVPKLASRLARRRRPRCGKSLAGSLVDGNALSKEPSP